MLTNGAAVNTLLKLVFQRRWRWKIWGNWTEQNPLFDGVLVVQRLFHYLKTWIIVMCFDEILTWTSVLCPIIWMAINCHKKQNFPEPCKNAAVVWKSMKKGYIGSGYEAWAKLSDFYFLRPASKIQWTEIARNSPIYSQAVSAWQSGYINGLGYYPVQALTVNRTIERNFGKL